MRILLARCEIAYHGRATTRLALGDRVILFKDDGSLCVHADRGYKPLNYMAGPTSVTEDGDVIRVYRAASDETLVIVVHEVLTDERRELVDEAVLEHDGAERQWHLLLERAPEAIEPGLVVLERERFTDTGPIDLFCRDVEGRTGGGGGEAHPRGGRARRAADPLRASRPDRCTPCRGILIALEIAPRRASCARPVGLASSSSTSACSRARSRPS
jgi:RecB family endonuclease NucS